MTPALCIRRGGLGDTLLAIPVLRAMRRRRPGAALHFAGVLEHAALLAQHRVVDRALSVEDLMLWSLAAGGPRAGAARARLARYAWIVTDAPLDLGPAAATRVRHLDPVLGDGAGLPAARVLLARAGLGDEPDAQPRLVEAPASVGSERAIVLHPGAGSARKCWPPARWRSLARALAGAGRAVCVVLGEAEHARGGCGLEGLPAGVEVLDTPPLARLAARIARAACFVGNDAGPTHLAAALLVPTVAVFGPTDPRVWAPVGGHVRVVGGRTGGAPDAAVGRVLAAVRAVARG